VSWFRRRAEDYEPAPFRPDPINVSELQARVQQHIDALLPSAIDEALPHVLDDWVDRSIEVEMARRLRALTEYQDKLMPFLVEARAEAAAEAIVNDADQRQLAELRLARDEAVRELLGTGRLPRSVRKRWWRRRRAQPTAPEIETPPSREE